MDGQYKLRSMGVMPVIRRRTKIFLIVILIGLFISPVWAIDPGPYRLSAHGDASIGVKRTERTDGYARGNCAHCHEQHGVIGGVSNGGPYAFALFSTNFSGASSAPYSASNDVCFLCHGPSSVQEGGIINYDYSETYGGYTGGPSTILDAFNLVNTSSVASYHNLKDIYNFAQNNFSFFTASSNPCVACHNPHLVKRIKTNQTDPASYTVVSLPSAHNTLWGDDSGEKMSDFTNYYQAPYYYNSSTSYEPGGSSTYNGSNLPDYATFCTACHNATNTIYSSNLGRNLRQIDWFSGGGDSASGTPLPDKHGKNSATVSVHLKNPFASSQLGITLGFVTSCTDCHEPHGSANPFLIRREVNGTIVSISGTDSNQIGYLCRACHKDDAAFGLSGGENRWEYIHHIADDHPYIEKQCGSCHGSGGGGGGKPPISCLNCHKHGSDDSWAGYKATGRICF